MKASEQPKQFQKWKYPNIFPKSHPKALYSREPSLLDPIDNNSELNKSNIKGFYNLAIIFAFAFLITKPISKFLSEGRFFDSLLFDTFMDGYVFCLLIWPLFFLWQILSYKVQVFYVFLAPKAYLAWFIAYSCVSSTTFDTGRIVCVLALYNIARKLVLKPRCFRSSAGVCSLYEDAFIYDSKQVSYVLKSRDYRQQYIQSIKQTHPAVTNYPSNINLKDFILFMMTPWLVYENYPRRQKINWCYAIWKASNVVVLILISYIMHTEYIMPYILMGDKISFLELVLRQMLPSILLIMVMFIMTFECFTNFFAEITKLDHRQFYEDWWNSTTFEEFNRKWNKPVHNFLYRHVYLELIVRYKTTKAIAQAVTFTFSAVLHQFLLAIIFRIFYPIFLVFIVFQIPLIYMTRFMKGRKSGNYLFWVGIVLGPTLILSIYLKIDQDVTQMFTDPNTQQLTYPH